MLVMFVLILLALIDSKYCLAFADGLSGGPPQCLICFAK